MRISDWSSDVCSSDLIRTRARPTSTSSPPRSSRGWYCPQAYRQWRSTTTASSTGRRQAWRGGARCLEAEGALRGGARGKLAASAAPDRKSDVKGKSVSVRVGLGGRRIIKKKNKN